MNIIIGTNNEYKAGEMRWILDQIGGVKVIPLKDTGIEINVEEDQSSLLGNAKKKARVISMHTDSYVLCSDGGMDIPGLGEKWDILRNQRIVGENNTDIVKVNKLIDLMRGLKDSERRAEYHFALALARNGKILWEDEEVTEKGIILEKLPSEDIPEYKWMGQVFYIKEFDKIHNNLTSEEREKFRVSGSKNLVDSLKVFIETS
ncbi:hypothetical protein GF357_02865, partial [Candidatus Dojkabacteria bacterium]|nr:hypothetical protein [Candidatus Dojkabacteria bacterium]